MIEEKCYDYKVTAAGRINIIGEHVDYCGGKVFPAALSLCNTVYVRPNGTDKINVSWTTLPQSVSLDIGRLETYRGLEYGNYQAGSALMWREAGHKLVGCDMLQHCTVPFGSGLSSSAAIEVSTIAALAVAAGEEFDPVEVAQLAQRAEREFAGVNCGIMDQYASACGKRGCVEQYASANGIVRVTKKRLAESAEPSCLRAMEHFACKDVFDAARSGDAFAVETLEQVVDYLGEALADACCVCDPERIILGGGVSRAGDYLLRGVERHFRAHMFHACKDTQFALATLGNDAGMYGAFRLLA